MVSYYGMNKELGNLSFYDSTGQNEYMFGKPYSEKTAETIDAEVKSIVEEAYQRAKNTLIENREGLNKLSELLLEREVIFSEDLEAIFGKRKGAKEELLSVKPVEDKNSLGDISTAANENESKTESETDAESLNKESNA